MVQTISRQSDGVICDFFFSQFQVKKWEKNDTLLLFYMVTKYLRIDSVM